ncbi:hypothetical protein OH76DRAFT_1402623 [Lentinus brumalis]|uniref:Uncharacterized protein n=1 Tax=Lentinus brumalis TaxID=2498619 RepID=A0A371DDL8_9APHY|nr:hypothetical protein OH76DRAFT_1402623 [Polyporus brumalis]
MRKSEETRPTTRLVNIRLWPTHLRYVVQEREDHNATRPMTRLVAILLCRPSSSAGHPPFRPVPFVPCAGYSRAIL